MSLTESSLQDSAPANARFVAAPAELDRQPAWHSGARKVGKVRQSAIFDPVEPNLARARRGPQRNLKILSRVALFGYTVAVLLLTMHPQLDRTQVPRISAAVLRILNEHGIPLIFMQLEALANVAMFVPLGLLAVVVLGVRGDGWLRIPLTLAWLLAVMYGVAFSVGIEAVQMFMPGRFADPRDIIHNGLGAVIGASLMIVWLIPSRVRTLWQARQRRKMRRRPRAYWQRFERACSANA